MNLEDAKKAVREWLFNCPARTTVNREWDNQYITDAAQMLMESHCKIEQLEIAHKSLVEELKDKGPPGGYERIKAYIEMAPQTWLPGLLGTVCSACIKQNVYRHDLSKAVAGMEATWRREKAAFPELQAGLERTKGK